MHLSSKFVLLSIVFATLASIFAHAHDSSAHHSVEAKKPHLSKENDWDEKLVIKSSNEAIWDKVWKLLRQEKVGKDSFEHFRRQKHSHSHHHSGHHHKRRFQNKNHHVIHSHSG